MAEPHKRIDQLDGREEADTLVMMLNSVNAEGGSNVGFACARAADEHDVVRLIDELAAMKLAHEGLVDLAADEVKAVGFRKKVIEILQNVGVDNLTNTGRRPGQSARNGNTKR